MVRMVRSRYPRRNHRLAPATLREVLRVPIPEKFFANRDRSAGPLRPGMMLCDLDESTWELFDEATCQAWPQKWCGPWAGQRECRRPSPINASL